MDRNSSPFTRTEAIGAGVSAPKLRGTEFRRIFRGVYVGASVTADIRLRAKAALRCVPPDGFVSHHTAALFWGGVPPKSPDVHVSRHNRKRRSVKRGIMVHLASDAALTTTYRRMPISTPEQCFSATAW
jgi:hypothetical protein